MGNETTNGEILAYVITNKVGEIHVVVNVSTYVDLDEPIADMDRGDKLPTLFMGYHVVQFIPVSKYIDWLFVDL